MKVGIHRAIVGGTFTERWIAYCEEKKIPYKIVNCYANDIIEQLADCDVLMWDFRQGIPRDMLFAKQLIFSLELIGKKVFPNSYTSWHYDDKLGQKYLFEAIGAPLVLVHVFYSREEALRWIQDASFPKVLKLRGGAASENVKLMKNRRQAVKCVNRAFSRGFSQPDKFQLLRERVRSYREGKANAYLVMKGIVRLIVPFKPEVVRDRQREYVYFQDFIPNQTYDIRVVAIQGKACALKRMVRKNDFRASGSGNLVFNAKEIPIEAIDLALQLAKQMRSQCAAFDFVFDADGKPYVTEVSFGFPIDDPWDGFWDSELNWHEGKFNPYGWMVESALQGISADNA